MNECETVIAFIYITAAATAAYCVLSKSSATFADVERYCIRRGVWAWYAFRIAAVVVLAGGFMHARELVFTAWGVAAKALAARK